MSFRIKDSYKAKHWLLIDEGIGLNRYNDFKTFIEYSNDMDDIYGNIKEYNLNKFTEKSYSLLVNDTTLAIGDLFDFRCKCLERI